MAGLDVLRFGYSPVPWWQWVRFDPAAALARRIAAHHYPVDAVDRVPADLAAWLRRWNVSTSGPMPAAEQVRVAAGAPAPAVEGPCRFPAQWEPVRTVLVTWPVLFPGLWAFHVELVAAIAPAATVTVLVPDLRWAPAVLAACGERAGSIEFLALPTDDIWVRDYGPVTLTGPGGPAGVLSMVYAPPPAADHAAADAVPGRWARHVDLPLRALDLRLEGGNLWSDGEGTLLTSDALLTRNADRPDAVAALREATGAERIVVLPRLRAEVTGHVDLLAKLAGPATVLLTRPTGPQRGRLADAARRLAGTTDARGRPFRVELLPALPPYLSWGVIPVWRSYTNSLTVNGRVIVPTFGEPTDAEALATYARVMPDHEVVHVDARVAANGGGTVHCLTMHVS